MQLLGNTAKLKAAALRKINRSSRGIERSDELIQNGIEQAGELIGAHGTHNDRKGTRKAFIRHPKLRKRTFELTIVGILLFDTVKRHQDTWCAAPKDAWRRYGARTNQDGNKRAVTQLEHQFVLGAISFKW